MSIWYADYGLEGLNKRNKDSMVEYCDINLTNVGDDTLEGEMLVSSKIKQPFGIVHGGANCVLAETLGSIAANMTVNPETHHGVGLSIQTNHIRAVRNGKVRGVAKAVHIGRTTQVWCIETFNDADQLTSSTQFTVSIIKKLDHTPLAQELTVNPEAE